MVKLALASAALCASASTVSSSRQLLQYQHISGENPKDIIRHSKYVWKGTNRLDVQLGSIIASGDVLKTPSGEEAVFGRLLNSTGHPIVDQDGNVMISNKPDFTSLLKSDKPNEFHTLTHFENPNPSIAYHSVLVHDPETCSMSVKSTEPVLFSEDEGGMWVPCSGTVTPWNTHLGSEEYEPDAYLYEQFVADLEAATTVDDKAEVFEQASWASYVNDMLMFYGAKHRKSGNMVDIRDVSQYYKFDPYRYGHPWEFTVNSAAPKGYEITKRYALGRAAHEMCLTAPDGKTSYCTDDGGNTALFKFVSDEAEKFESGVLSCAKVEQTSSVDGGAFSVSWVQLANVTASTVTTIKSMVESPEREQRIKFSDLFLSVEPVDGACEEGFTYYYADVYGGEYAQCMKPKPGNLAGTQVAIADAIAILETRRACAMNKGTIEFSKLEGITLNQDTNTYYMAASQIVDGMVEGHKEFDVNSGDHIRLEENKCGCIYAMTTKPGTYDIDAMESLICGTPVVDDVHACSTSSIAEPDNIAMQTGYGALLIAEDKTLEEERLNFFWSMNLATKQLTRIATVESGAEVTSPAATHFPDVEKCDYTMFISQHPTSTNAALYYMSSATDREYVYTGPLVTATASNVAPGVAALTLAAALAAKFGL